MTKKVHIIGCDGTWQKKSQKNPTNVPLLLQSLDAFDAAGNPQVSKYFDGVGSQKKFLSKIWAGITGKGISQKIRDAYLYLAENYNPDDEIILIGFSRGSYSARSLAGMIYKCGILDRRGPGGNNLQDAVEKAYKFYRCALKPNGPEAQAFREKHSIKDANGPLRPKMKIACFDTVGALGIPRTPLNIISGIINLRDQFHDTKVNRDITLALHAVAIDETRKHFSPTPMEKSDGAGTAIHTRYFIGDHTTVGGGENTEDKPLSDIPALWIAKKLEENSSLRFDPKKLKDTFNPNAQANLGRDFGAKGFWHFFKSARKIDNPDLLDPSVKERIKIDATYRPKPLRAFIQKLLG